MKKILIGFVIVQMLFLMSFLNLEAALKTISFEMRDECYIEEGNQFVYTECDANLCALVCFGGGNTRCCFECSQDCWGCDESFNIYRSALGEEMFDHMHEQILLNQLIGSYNSNIIY